MPLGHRPSARRANPRPFCPCAICEAFPVIVGADGKHHVTAQKRNVPPKGAPGEESSDRDRLVGTTTCREAGKTHVSRHEGAIGLLGNVQKGFGESTRSGNWGVLSACWKTGVVIRMGWMTGCDMTEALEPTGRDESRSLRRVGPARGIAG
jgi:hypothetical protein